MITRTEFYWEFKECPKNIDFSLIKEEGEKFIDIINSRNETILDLLNTYISAKRSFQNCLAYLKSYIDPKDNSLINSQSDGYKIFLGNLGRWTQIIDNIEKGITSVNSNINRSIGSMQFDVNKLGEELMSGFDVGIYGTIHNANLRFKEDYIKKDGTRANKSKDLYGYLIFYEFSNSAEIFGPQSRMPGGERKNPGEFSHRLPLPYRPHNFQEEVDESSIGVEDLFMEEGDEDKSSSQEFEPI